MGIFDAPVKTEAEKAADFIRTKIAKTLTIMCQHQKEAFGILWNNPKAKAEDILAALGSEAAEVFRLSALNIATMNSAKPGTWTAAPPREFEVHQDGTITLKPLPEPEPEA